MELSTYYQIKTGSSTPSASNTPALAAATDRMHIVYVGQGGQNLWWVQGTQPADPGSWTNNVQIKDVYGNALTTHDPPALAFFDNSLVLAYTTTDHKGVTVVYFDGNQWRYDQKAGAALPSSNYGYSLPLLIVAGGKLNLFVCDGTNLTYLWTTAPYTGEGSWSTIQNINSFGVAAVAATVDGSGKLIMAMIPGPPNKFVNLQYSIFDPANPTTTNWYQGLADVEQAANEAALTRNVAVNYGWGGYVGFVYQAKGKGSQLYSASLNQALSYQPPLAPLRLSPSSEVDGPKGSSQGVKAQNAPALCNFNNQFVCIAHQGQDSDNLWFGTTTY